MLVKAAVTVAAVVALPIYVPAQSGLPAIAADGIVNAADGSKPSPGAIISIYGMNLADAITVADKLPFPNTINGVSVHLNGQAEGIPLLFVSPRQINAQLPYNLNDSTLRVHVRTRAGTSASVIIQATTSWAGVFTRSMNGEGEALVFHSNFTFITEQNPARGGETVIMYATGLGSVQPTLAAGVAAGDGSDGRPLNKVVQPVQVRIAGTFADVVYAGLAPGFAGVYQINFIVPTAVDGYNSTIQVSTTSGTSQKYIYSRFVPAVWPPLVQPILDRITQIVVNFRGAHMCKDLTSQAQIGCNTDITLNTSSVRDAPVTWAGNTFVVKGLRSIGTQFVVSDSVDMSGEVSPDGSTLVRADLKMNHSETAGAGVVFTGGHVSAEKDTHVRIMNLPLGTGIPGPTGVTYASSGSTLQSVISVVRSVDTQTFRDGKVAGRIYVGTDWSRPAELSVAFRRP